MLLKLALISFKNKAYFLVEFWLHNKMLHAIRIEIVNTFSQCRGQVLKKCFLQFFFPTYYKSCSACPLFALKCLNCIMFAISGGNSVFHTFGY